MLLAGTGWLLPVFGGGTVKVQTSSASFELTHRMLRWRDDVDDDVCGHHADSKSVAVADVKLAKLSNSDINATLVAALLHRRK